MICPDGRSSETASIVMADAALCHFEPCWGLAVAATLHPFYVVRTIQQANRCSPNRLRQFLPGIIVYFIKTQRLSKWDLRCAFSPLPRALPFYFLEQKCMWHFSRLCYLIPKIAVLDFSFSVQKPVCPPQRPIQWTGCRPKAVGTFESKEHLENPEDPLTMQLSEIWT